MKDINNYINEKLNLSKASGSNYKYFPETREELRSILEERLAEDKNANLNDIDVSEITDMGPRGRGANKIGLFAGLKPRNIDISQWNVSNVTNMSYMFDSCTNFNSDLSKWDVSKVKDMSVMFYECKNFNSDLSKWDVSKVKDMFAMFDSCANFNSDLSKWDVSKVKCIRFMFNECTNFNSDLNSWNVSKVRDMYYTFDGCKSLKNIPTWYNGK